MKGSYAVDVVRPSVLIVQGPLRKFPDAKRHTCLHDENGVCLDSTLSHVWLTSFSRSALFTLPPALYVDRGADTVATKVLVATSIELVLRRALLCPGTQSSSMSCPEERVVLVDDVLLADPFDEMRAALEIAESVEEPALDSEVRAACDEA